MNEVVELGQVWHRSDGTLWLVVSEDPDEGGLSRAVNISTGMDSNQRIVPGRYWRLWSGAR